MPTTPQAPARTHAPTMDDYQGWKQLRNQSECLAMSLVNEVALLHELPATSVANHSLAEIRDRLSDLLTHVRMVREGGAQ